MVSGWRRICHRWKFAVHFSVVGTKYEQYHNNFERDGMRATKILFMSKHLRQIFESDNKLSIYKQRHSNVSAQLREIRVKAHWAELQRIPISLQNPVRSNKITIFYDSRIETMRVGVLVTWFNREAIILVFNGHWLGGDWRWSEVRENQNSLLTNSVVWPWLDFWWVCWADPQIYGNNLAKNKKKSTQPPLSRLACWWN